MLVVRQRDDQPLVLERNGELLAVIYLRHDDRPGGRIVANIDAPETVHIVRGDIVEGELDAHGHDRINYNEWTSEDGPRTTRQLWEKHNAVRTTN